MASQHDRGARFELLRVYGPAVFAAAIGFAIAYQFVDPAPPSRLTMATGAPQGAYHGFAERYRDILAREGIELRLRPSAGSVENVALLQQSQADVAFVQGGIGELIPVDGLVSLGSLYYEPLWIFHRAELELGELSALAGRRIAIGPPGSGTRAVAERILDANDIGEGDFEPHDHGGAAAVPLLQSGELDAVFVVAAAGAENVVVPLRAPGVSTMSMRRADAYARHHRFITKVVLPEGVIDLRANLPPRDVTLVATAANLLAREDLHPALVDLLLLAASEVHRDGGLFERPGAFPSRQLIDLPLSEDAARFFDTGPSFLRRTLPFWAATLIERLLVMLVPLVAIVIPLVRIMPAVYRWRVRSRIYRWYKALRPLEAQGLGGARAPVERCLGELARIEEEVLQVSIPWAYAEELYQLRLHIDLVRGRLEQARAAAGSAEPSGAS